MAAFVVPSSLQNSTTFTSHSATAKNITGLHPQSLQFKSRKTFEIRASFEDANYSTTKVVTIPHSDLLDRSAYLSEELEAGFGPNGLGIIAISDVPRYPILRKDLLQLSHRLAALPDEAKKNLEDPDS
ncbi:hypothetical protein KI387_012603, partial [Taxus chinensis]